MYLHPTLGEQLVHDRQRDFLAQASRLRLAREARQASRMTRQAEPAQQRKGLLFWRRRPVVSPS